MKWIKEWISTILILINRPLMRDIRKAEEEFKRGETIPWSNEKEWDRIDKFFEENKDIQPYYEEVSRKLLNDECYSLHIHYVQTIEKLLEVISDLRSE